MRARRTLIGLSLAALTLVAASPAHAQKVSNQQLFGQQVVGPGGILSFKLTCPPGWIALSGAVVANDEGATVRYVRPSTQPNPSADRQWEFSFDNSAGNQPATVRVVVTCVRDGLSARLARLIRLATRTKKKATLIRLLPPIKLTPKQKKKKKRPITVGIPDLPLLPGTTLSPPRLVCPKGSSPAGFGADTTGGEPQQPSGGGRSASIGSVGTVLIDVAEPFKRGWTFALRNPGSRAATVGLSVRCVRNKLRLGDLLLRLRTRVVTAQQTVGFGNTRLGLECPPKHFAARTGHSLPPGANASLWTSWNGPGGVGTWDVVSLQLQPLTVGLHLICVGNRLKSRRVGG